MSDGNEAGSGTRDVLEDNNDTGGFSEHELLDIMYNACNTSNTGEVLASTMLQYLQTMTTQSPEQDRLAALRRLLDPDCQDPHVSRETFHSIMREWIAQCSQDSSDLDSTHVSWPDSSKDWISLLPLQKATSVYGLLSPFFNLCMLPPVINVLSFFTTHCFDGKDLLGTVAELKHAHRKLSEQNSSLLRTVAQCEDVNLQLSLEVTELRAKLTSAQRSAVRARSQTEELEETRRAFKEAQERASRTQSSCTKLNEKLTFERTCSEDSLNKLRKANTELRAELEETLVMLTLRDREIAKKDILMDKMKNCHMENHSMIEGLQSEMVKYDRHCISPQSLYSRDPPNHRSLQSEMHDMQQDSAPVETQERPRPQRQQQQASIKQQLVNAAGAGAAEVCVGGKREKVEERRRAWEKEQKQSQTESQTQMQDAKKVAVVNWWKAHSVEGAKARTKDPQPGREVSETRAKLQQAEQTISDMREQICLLQASVRSAQECVTKQKNRSLYINKGTNTEREEPGRAVEKVVKDQRDAAVATEITGGASEQEQTQLRATADGLLKTLRRMEAMVNSALETAELVRESEQRVGQVRERMESITLKVEEALERAADSDQKLNNLEAKSREKDQTQSPGLSVPADPGTDVTVFEAEADVEPAGGDGAPPSPVIPGVSGTGRGGCSELQEEEDHFPQGSPPEQSDHNPEESCAAPCPAERPFVFPSTRSRPPLLPTMPTLPEEEEDSPEEMDSSSSSPSTSTPSRAVVMTGPTIIYPQQATIFQQDGRPLEQTRPHSPRTRTARNCSGGPITRVDSTGNLIDLVKDPLAELQLSEEDRQKNLELLQQAKKVSDRFLTRRGRRSLTDSPPAVGPTEATHVSSQSVGQHLELSSLREQTDLTTQDHEGNRLLVDWKPSEKRKVSSGTLTPRFAVQKENCDPASVKQMRDLVQAETQPDPSHRGGQARPRPPTQQAPCTAEIKTIGAFPPLMRAVSWDTVGTLNSRNGAPSFPPTAEDTFSDKPRDAAFKSSGYKDLPGQQGSVQKLSKFREEHKLMRNQSIVGSKLADLSEAAEQEKGPPASPNSVSNEEAKEKTDSMPNTSDLMLRKLKLHRVPPLSLKKKLRVISCGENANIRDAVELGLQPLSLIPLGSVWIRTVRGHIFPLRRGPCTLEICRLALINAAKHPENAFVQLSLAFRNDNYTLEMRLKQAERERNLTEEETERELGDFKGALKVSSPQWQNLEQREAFQRLIETLAVLHRLATRLSSRSEIVGAVRQEKRMNKATEVMMQYVENLKRTYEKDHAELMEFKKLANQNSIRCYGPSADTGDDGIPRPSRSMSLTLGKALPRRRVSVAVVPKFNLLNIPGQTPATAFPGLNMGPSTGPITSAALPVLCEANDVKANAPSEAAQPAAECGKSVSEPESEPAKPPVNLEEIRAEIRAELKAKMEEETYNKGYQEGLKQSKVLQEEKQEEENAAEKLLESKNKDEESGKKRRTSRRMEEVLVLLGRFWPKFPLSRRLLWVALTLFVGMCLVISIFTFFSDYYKKREDT
ncbi:hypothetical protein F7725_026329 [Dissostichus mawsoni]|uniref:MRVI1 n=1 Tax=Dissostichus mawsoni TaxID=36200 RepID=A0A7J5X6P5_DISMA|nr:hypothetical protein F7725_026329 [Dissostichus mawsoni]